MRKLVYNAAEFSDDDGIVYTFSEFFANNGQSLSDDLEIINCNPLDCYAHTFLDLFRFSYLEGVLRDSSKLKMDGQRRERNYLFIYS